MTGHGGDHVPLPVPPDTVAVTEGSRALVAEVTSATERRNVLARPAATFVAQLLATAADSPQTRVLRRAEPIDAASAYGAKPVAPAETAAHLSKLF